VTNDGDGLALAKAYPVEDLRMADDFVPSARFAVEPAENIEETRDATDSRENALLFGDDGGSGAQRGLDGHGRGHIAGGLILSECLLQNGFDAAALPLHDLFEALLWEIVEGLADLVDEETVIGYGFSKAFDDVRRSLVEKSLIAELAFGGGESLLEFGQFFGQAFTLSGDVDGLSYTT
jgi:hypothetical protein